MFIVQRNLVEYQYCSLTFRFCLVCNIKDLMFADTVVVSQRVLCVSGWNNETVCSVERHSCVEAVLFHSPVQARAVLRYYDSTWE